MLLEVSLYISYNVDASCFLANKDSIGNTIQNYSNIVTASKCQDVCQNTTACHYFVLNERNEGQNGCYLKSKSAIRNVVTKTAVTLGPKFCPNGGKYIYANFSNL